MTATGSAAAIAGYAARAEALTARYNAISTDAWYAPVRHLIPTRPSRVIDIGAGTGRDAIWLADMGHHVTAVEPVAAFVEAARRRDTRIGWIVDALPTLPQVIAENRRFDLITLSAVWQHLDEAERKAAGPVLRFLAAPGATLILALRHGPASEGRPVNPIDVAATEALFATQGFSTVFRRDVASIQPQNLAAGVTWTWLALCLKSVGTK
jgi:SAM-dependent methyltransferase